MESSLLRVFLAVVDTGSLSGAAKVINCVQSNVTARLKQLEEDIGKSLFYRKPPRGGVALTDAGEKLLPPHAREIVQKLDETEIVMKDTGERRLRIGSTESNAAVRLAPPVLVKLHASNPKLKLELFTAPTKFIMEKLLDYQLDIAFISGVPSSKEIKVLKQIDEEMVIVEPLEEIVPPDVILSFKKRVYI